MMAIAKIFKNGDSQAIRLPKKFRFNNQKEVIIKSIEGGVVLLEKNENSWDNWFNSFEKVSDDFIRVQTSQQREELF
jgi:antitoxin VapB